MKSRRATLRRQITMINRQIEPLISVRGSRGTMRRLLHQDLLLRSSRIHTEILSIEEDEEEAERRNSTNLAYIARSTELSPDAQVHLNSREGETESMVRQFIVPNPFPPAPLVSPSEVQRREQARPNEVTAAQLKADQAREQAEIAWQDTNAAQADLRLLGIENRGRVQ